MFVLFILFIILLCYKYLRWYLMIARKLYIDYHCMDESMFENYDIKPITQDLYNSDFNDLPELYD